MTDTVNAVVTRKRGIRVAGVNPVHYADGKVLLDLPRDQFEDWRAIGWVDGATNAQVADAKARAAEEAARMKAEKAGKSKAEKAAKTETEPKAEEKPA